MLWSIPRSDPGAATEHLRLVGAGVSRENGALPYGRLPRVVLLWMYAEVLRTGHGILDFAYSFCDYLSALGLREELDLAEQSSRLFDCTLHFEGQVGRMSHLVLVGWSNAEDSGKGYIPRRESWVSLNPLVYEAMLRRPVRLCMHSLRGRCSTRHSSSTCICGTPTTPRTRVRALRRTQWGSTGRWPSRPCSSRAPTSSPPSSTSSTRRAGRLHASPARSRERRRNWCTHHRARLCRAPPDPRRPAPSAFVQHCRKEGPGRIRARGRGKQYRHDVSLRPAPRTSAAPMRCSGPSS